MYIAMAAPWNENFTPDEIARTLISRTTNLDFVFLSYSPSMPMLLDEVSLKTYPPFHMQVTLMDNDAEYVDYVYLAQAKAAPDFPPNAELGWFNQSNIKNSPAHVKHIIHHILSAVNGTQGL